MDDDAAVMKRKLETFSAYCSRTFEQQLATQQA
jgi:hypothetical protein